MFAMLLKLIVRQPSLLLNHARAYADLAVEETSHCGCLIGSNFRQLLRLLSPGKYIADKCNLFL